MTREVGPGEEWQLWVTWQGSCKRDAWYYMALGGCWVGMLLGWWWVEKARAVPQIGIGTWVSGT